MGHAGEADEDGMEGPVAQPEPDGVKPTSAQPPRKRTMAALVSHLVGGNMTSMAIRLVSGVLQGRLVEPATLGLFTGIGLALRYAPFFQLGILDGLYRELPFFIGKGERARAEQLASAAQAWALVVGGAYALVLLVIGGWHLVHAELWMAAGWVTMAVQAIVFYYKTYYLQVTYRTAHDFSRLALVGVLESVSSLVLLALVAWLSFYGLCLRALLVSAVGTGILFFWRPIRVRPAWNVAHMKHLLKIGLPIFSVGQLYAFWSVLNATLVLKFMGTEGMGLYAMVLMAYTSIEFIPVAVRQIVYPRMAQHYGAHHCISDLVPMALKPAILTAAGLVPIVAVAWFLVAPVVHWVVPAYAKAIPAIQWAILLPIVNSFYPLASIFQVVRRQDLYAIAVGTGMATYLVVQMWLIRNNTTLAAFPQTMLVGQIVFSAVCMRAVFHLRHRERAALATSTSSPE